MQDVLRNMVNLLSLTINIGLAYFAVRLTKISKCGTKEKPLLYISACVLTIATGSSSFSLYCVLGLPSAHKHCLQSSQKVRGFDLGAGGW